MNEDSVEDLSNVTVGDLKSITQLADRIKVALAAEQREFALRQLKVFIENAILDGAKSYLYDRAHRASEADLPAILCDAEDLARQMSNVLMLPDQKWAERMKQLAAHVEALRRRPLFPSLPPVEHIFRSAARTQYPIELKGVPPDDIECVKTLDEVAEFALTHFGHKPSRRAIAKWKADLSLRIGKHNRLWYFSRSDLEKLVRKPSKKSK